MKRGTGKGERSDFKKTPLNLGVPPPNWGLDPRPVKFFVAPVRYGGAPGRFFQSLRSPFPVLFTLFLLFACSSQKSPTLATVNGQKISVADFQKAMELEQWKYGGEVGFTPERWVLFKQQTLDILLRETLLLQEASKRNIQVFAKEVDQMMGQLKKQYPKGDDFEKLLQAKGLSLEDFKERRIRELQIKQLMEKVTLEQLPITDNLLKKYYESHLQEFKHGEQVRARQIVSDSPEKANALKKMIEEGKPFEEVAQEYSMSPDRKKGGDLGWFERGMMPEEFDHVCFRLKPGQRSLVVKTPYGFHIFEVLEKRRAGFQPFDEAKEAIRRRMMAEAGAEAFQKWYEPLYSSAKIEVKQDLLETIK